LIVPNSTTLARVVFVLTLLMYVAALVLGVFSLVNHVPHEANDFIFTSSFGFGLLAVATVGVLVAVHRPGHPVGWVLLGGAASMTVPMLGGQYAVFVLYVRPGPPGATVGAWSTEWFLTPGVFVMPASSGRSAHGCRRWWTDASTATATTRTWCSTGRIKRCAEVERLPGPRRSAGRAPRRTAGRPVTPQAPRPRWPAGR
jgi:hypothetical protein